MKHEKQWKEASVQIVEPAVEAITEPDIWKRLELIGRVCYKSEHKITEDSALPFCEMLFSKRHLSVFEHGNITTIAGCKKGICNMAGHRRTA